LKKLRREKKKDYNGSLFLLLLLLSLVRSEVSSV
jgi:hypothetical protein